MYSEFYNRKAAQQLVNFSGLIDGSKSATDIDGLIEWDNKFYIIYEVKHGSRALSYGQNLALTRLCDDLQKVKPAILIVCEHSIDNPEEDIFLKDCKVRSFRFEGVWKTVDFDATAKDFTSFFINKFA